MLAVNEEHFVNLFGAQNFLMPHISWLMCAVVVIIALRLGFELRRNHIAHKRLYAILVIGVLASSVLFFQRTWSLWAFCIVCGLMLGCSVLSRSRPKVLQVALSSTAVVLAAGGLLGLTAPWAPVISYGPSMWPTSPKGFSLSVLNTHKQPQMEYGDDVYFEAMDSKNWPDGRYRKRIWALPGDQIEVEHDIVLINQRVVADCSDRSRRIAPNVWWCTVRFPNGVTKEITWGVSNVGIPPVRKTLGEHQVFAIGDNTVESTDSRVLSPIDARWIEGRFDSAPSKRATWTPWM